MTEEEFDDILKAQVERVQRVLGRKAVEYATDNERLSNFRTAADLQNITVPACIVSLMAKHVVSIYDMVGTGEKFTLDQWDEKITDNINYLILLRAAVEEEFNDYAVEEVDVAEAIRFGKSQIIN